MADDKRVLRLPAVMERTGLSKASIYRLIKASDFRQQFVWDVGLWGGPPIGSTSGSTPVTAPPAVRSGSEWADGELFSSTSNAAHPHVQTGQGVANLDDGTERFRPWRGRDATG